MSLLKAMTHNSQPMSGYCCVSANYIHLLISQSYFFPFRFKMFVLVSSWLCFMLWSSATLEPFPIKWLMPQFSNSQFIWLEAKMMLIYRLLISRFCLGWAWRKYIFSLFQNAEMKNCYPVGQHSSFSLQLLAKQSIRQNSTDSWTKIRLDRWREMRPLPLLL